MWDSLDEVLEQQIGIEYLNAIPSAVGGLYQHDNFMTYLRVVLGPGGSFKTKGPKINVEFCYNNGNVADPSMPVSIQKIASTVSDVSDPEYLDNRLFTKHRMHGFDTTTTNLKLHYDQPTSPEIVIPELCAVLTLFHDKFTM